MNGMIKQICSGLEIIVYRFFDCLFPAKTVFKLQNKIGIASQSNQLNQVHFLQEEMINLPAAKWFAIRKARKKKKVAGPDGISELSFVQTVLLFFKLKIDGKTKPVGQLWITKINNNKELRPVAVFSIEDRIKQQLVKLALEPQWETKFENSCYGSRRNGGVYKAMAEVHKNLGGCEKFVLKGDIKNFFVDINQEKLLNKLSCSKSIQNQVAAWLTVEIAGKDPQKKNQGIPQGCILSPLLGNIALCGIENECRRASKAMESLEVPVNGDDLHLIFYVDDFVVIHSNLKVIQGLQEVIAAFLQNEMDLSLHPEKTFICSNLKPLVLSQDCFISGSEVESRDANIIEPGFKFLGNWYQAIIADGKIVSVYSKLEKIGYFFFRPLKKKLIK